MLYRRLGRAGVKVSEISYGSWITAGGKYPKEESIACHKRAYELGINLFDTADVYQGGQAEEIVGEVLQIHARGGEQLLDDFAELGVLDHHRFDV